jgi:hypothetical protein
MIASDGEREEIPKSLRRFLIGFFNRRRPSTRLFACQRMQWAAEEATFLTQFNFFRTCS